MKKVYLAMSVDTIHPGHIIIIQKAAKLGELTVGVLRTSFNQFSLSLYPSRDCLI